MRWSKVKYVRHGHGPDGPVMYVIIMNHTEHGNWKVEVSPSDHRGSPVSDALEWDIFPGYWSARSYMNRKYKEYSELVNRRF